MTHYHVINHDLGLIACFSPKCACITLKDWFRNSLPAHQAQNWKGMPGYRYFYNPELVSKVERLYRNDLACYRTFHDDRVLFKRQVSAHEPA